MNKYPEILKAMQQRFFELSGFDAADATDVGIRMKALSAELAVLYDQFELLQQQAFPQTSTGEYLELHAQTRGISRKAPIGAGGLLTFSRVTAADQDIIIPENTLCSTGGDPIVRFATTVPSALPAGELSISVPAVAIDQGVQGNVAPHTITLIVTPPQGISAVTNPAALSGGVDAETDDQLKKRLLTSFSNISNGTNRAYYYNEALKWIGVSSANVLSVQRGPGTVDVIISGDNQVPPASVVSGLQAYLAEKREINVDVLVRTAALKPVSLTIEVAPTQNTTFETLKTLCLDKIRQHIAGLGVGKPMILSALGHELFTQSGIYNYRFIQPLQDVYIEEDEVASAGTITVNRMAVTT